MAAAVVEGSDSSLNILIHPMVILNISDHFMRTRAGAAAGSSTRVVGFIAGVVKGRTIEVLNSFEVTITGEPGSHAINMAYFKDRFGQFHQVFPTYDVLGWYSTGTQVEKNDIAMHKQVLEACESPLFLQLDSNVAAHKDLPVRVYELDAHDRFVNLPYKIDATPAEGIAINHISKHTSSGEDAAARLQVHLSGLHSAVKILGSRVKVIVQYMIAVKKGEVPWNPAIMRQVASLCHRMPTLDTASFQKDHLSEYNDAVLMAYLTSLTKSTQALNEVVDRFNYGFDRHSRRRGFM